MATTFLDLSRLGSDEQQALRTSTMKRLLSDDAVRELLERINQKLKCSASGIISNFAVNQSSSNERESDDQFMSNGQQKARRLELRAVMAPPNGYYNEAKRFEYVERNLSKAIEYYRLAISNGDKVDSAIKDLAAVLHQTGKTRQAVSFLEGHRITYRGDLEKYDNLILNLAKQIVAPSGKNLNKSLLAIGVPYNVEMVKSLFANSSRIIEVRFYTDQSFNHEATKEQWDESARFNCNCFCLITFLSYSAAKKTLDTLKPDQNVQLYWVNVNKIVVGEAASDENIGCTNSFYQGYVWFGAGLIVEDDKDLVPSDKLREIENIWKTDTVEDNVSNTHRLKVENETKLDMIRNKKYRYQLL